MSPSAISQKGFLLATIKPQAEKMWTDPRFARWKGDRYVPAVLARSLHDLEAYHHQPIQAIAQRYWQLRDRQDQLPVRAEEVDAYYHTTDQYVYESTYFETYAEYQWVYETARRACQQFGRAPALDFGGGAGGLTLALALGGVPCDYADIPGPTMDYARWRFARHGCASRTLDAAGGLPPSSYGAIITIDVFEHLLDLERTLQVLANALRPGGWLISKSTFAGGDPLHLPQNFQYADVGRFNALMRDMRLAYRGRLRPDLLSEQWFRWTNHPRIWRVWLDAKPKFGGRFLVHERAA